MEQRTFLSVAFTLLFLLLCRATSTPTPSATPSATATTAPTATPSPVQTPTPSPTSTASPTPPPSPSSNQPVVLASTAATAQVWRDTLQFRLTPRVLSSPFFQIAFDSIIEFNSANTAVANRRVSSIVSFTRSNVTVSGESAEQFVVVGQLANSGPNAQLELTITWLPTGAKAVPLFGGSSTRDYLANSFKWDWRLSNYVPLTAGNQLKFLWEVSSDGPAFTSNSIISEKDNLGRTVAGHIIVKVAIPPLWIDITPQTSTGPTQRTITTKAGRSLDNQAQVFVVIGDAGSNELLVPISNPVIWEGGSLRMGFNVTQTPTALPALLPDPAVTVGALVYVLLAVGIVAFIITIVGISLFCRFVPGDDDFLEQSGGRI